MKMESRNKCIVKYVGHRVWKDIWPVFKLILIVTGILALIAGAIYSLFILSHYIGADFISSIIFWIIAIVYIGLTLHMLRYDNDVPSFILWVVGWLFAACTAFFVVPIGAGGKSAFNVPFPTVQMLVMFLWAPVLGAGRYLDVIIDDAIRYCDELLKDATK